MPCFCTTQNGCPLNALSPLRPTQAAGGAKAWCPLKITPTRRPLPVGLWSRGERAKSSQPVQKKSMKTKNTKKNQEGLPNSISQHTAPEPVKPEPAEQAKPTRILPYVNFKQREENRALATEKVLDLLRQWLPKAYDLAEVVGKWVWVTFPEQPAEQVRGQLSQFGFHWNNSRKCWQHPCGQFATEGSGQDPRQKYGSHFAADLKAA